MPDYATEPMTFTAAADFMRRKVRMPNNLSSRDIALKVPAKLRGQAFFSAGVASTRILDRLRGEVEMLERGKTDYVSARARLKTFLADSGYGRAEVGTKEDRDVRRLESTARLDLILRQNVAMAHAVGQREVSENEAVVEIYPNYRYVANTKRHARFDGLVLPKSDPFWQTHYPPWEFNCKCMAIDSDEAVNAQSFGMTTHKDGSQSGRLTVRGRTMELEPSKSGFVFRSDPKEAFAEPDFNLISDDALREMLMAEWDKKKREWGL